MNPTHPVWSTTSWPISPACDASVCNVPEITPSVSSCFLTIICGYISTGSSLSAP
jgi:hypothetical protein